MIVVLVLCVCSIKKKETILKEYMRIKKKIAQCKIRLATMKQSHVITHHTEYYVTLQ